MFKFLPESSVNLKRLFLIQNTGLSNYTRRMKKRCENNMRVHLAALCLDYAPILETKCPKPIIHFMLISVAK